MDLSQFETLYQKVETAVQLIEELKKERDHLKSELHSALEKSGHLEHVISERDQELDRLRGDLDQKSDNMNQAGDRIRDMMSRLEAVLA